MAFGVWEGIGGHIGLTTLKRKKMKGHERAYNIYVDKREDLDWLSSWGGFVCVLILLFSILCLSLPLPLIISSFPLFDMTDMYNGGWWTLTAVYNRILLENDIALSVILSTQINHKFSSSLFQIQTVHLANTNK